MIVDVAIVRALNAAIAADAAQVGVAGGTRRRRVAVRSLLVLLWRILTVGIPHGRLLLLFLPTHFAFLLVHSKILLPCPWCRQQEPGAGGTLPPAFRASERPIAIACLRLRTRVSDPPDLSSPRFISCSARPTFSEAFPRSAWPSCVWASGQGFALRERIRSKESLTASRESGHDDPIPEFHLALRSGSTSSNIFEPKAGLLALSQP